MPAEPKNYVPRASSVRWKSFLLIFIACCVLAYGGQWLFSQREKKQEDSYGVCGLTNLKTRELFADQSAEEDEFLTLGDWLYYGETLNLYHQPYERGKQDLFAGKTVILRNLCTGLDFVYMMEKSIDGQIPLEDLDPGFYQVYILQNLKEKQLIAEAPLSDVFYTVTRGGTNHKIELLADQTLFDNPDEEQPFLTHNYVFVKVEEQAQPEDWIDVMIDPGGLNRDNGFTDKGVHGNGLEAWQENYRIAVKLKEILEQRGLKVELTRSEEETVNSYGENGRLHRAYQKHARYYLDIEMKSATNPALYGTDIVYSSFSSNRLAASVLKSIVENTSLSYARSNTGTASGTSTGEDGTAYDGQKMVRESGGRLTGAGTFSEASRENAAFAADNRCGMQTLTIQYLYLSNSSDTQIWLQELDQIAAATADGLTRYLRIN